MPDWIITKAAVLVSLVAVFVLPTATSTHGGSDLFNPAATLNLSQIAEGTSEFPY